MNITAADVQNVKSMQTRLCVGAVCLNSSNSTLCIGTTCLNASDITAVNQASSQINSTELCAGGTCLTSTDLSNVKALPSAVNSTSLCIGSNCIAPSDLTNLKALPQRINSSSVCIGSSCVGVAELNNLRNLTTQHNATNLCLGSSCVNSVDLVNLRSLPTRVNSTSFCVGNTCLNSTEFSNVLAIPSSKAYAMMHLADSNVPSGTNLPWNIQWGSRVSLSADKRTIIFQDPGYYAVNVKVNFDWTGTCDTFMTTWVYNTSTTTWINLRSSEGGSKAYDGTSETTHLDLFNVTPETLQWRIQFTNPCGSTIFLSASDWSKMTIFRVA